MARSSEEHPDHAASKERMDMQWYLLKTWVGKEEELVQEIRRTVPPSMYKECFVIYQKRVWRKQQRSVVHVEVLFPGCVFLVCEKIDSGDKKDSVYARLEKVPAITQLMNCEGFSMFPMMKEDVDFLVRISGRDHMVGLSYVLKREDGQTCIMSGPLRECQGQIERYQFKKRYAMVRQRLWGESQVIVLGILLKEDAVQKLLYENMEVSMEMPEWGQAVAEY